MIITVPKETAEHEKRVALVPDTIGKLIEKDIEVLVEKGAGTSSNYPDELYREAGASITEDRSEIFTKADLLICIRTPDEDDLEKLNEGAILIGFLQPLQDEGVFDFLRKHDITSLAMEAIPRISRAQNMDALSSMSSIAGYKSALIGADELDRYMPMMMTAAGTIAPAKVLVLGAGVAGLQAIATAKRLGASIEAFDIRPAVKEQVESLGATFVEVPDLDEDTETEGGYAKELAEDKQERQRQVSRRVAEQLPGLPVEIAIEIIGQQGRCKDERRTEAQRRRDRDAVQGSLAGQGT